MSTVVLSGGVGAARFLSGLTQVMDQQDITVISNTGDDSVFWGLYVCPDIDIVIYTLADMINPQTGWGLKEDTFATLNELKRLGEEVWFHLGDRDMATHLYRTMLKNQGMPLSQITAKLSAARGLRCKILPMTDERLETRFKTDQGELAFQEYMVKLGWKVPVRKICFQGAAQAQAAPGVLEAIKDAERVIIAPSNPLISIGAILSVPGIQDALMQTEAKIAAISPIVGGQTIKGPAADLMRDQGYPVSAYGVAEIYKSFVDLLIIDQQDADLLPKINALGIHAVSTDTMMTNAQRKKELAKFVVEQMAML